jgi:hypothetical protein
MGGDNELNTNASPNAGTSGSTAALAGGVAAGVVAIAAAAGVGYLVWRKKQRASMVKHVFNPAYPDPEHGAMSVPSSNNAVFRKSTVRV